MNYTTEISDSTATITPTSGRFDANLAPEFRTVVAEAIEQTAQRVVVDMRNVHFIDSSGLGSIVACHKLLQKDNGIALINVNPTVKEIFRLTHMDKVFDLDNYSPDQKNNLAA